MPKPNAKQLRILVIEDNNDHWTLIEKVIAKCFTNAMAIRVASAETAIRFLEECLQEEWAMPKLILLDLYLPTLNDGLALLKRIRNMSPSGRRVPVIMLSSSEVQADISKAYDTGVSSYCLKPTNSDGWVALFEGLQTYWLQTVTLPPEHYSLF